MKKEIVKKLHVIEKNIWKIELKIQNMKLWCGIIVFLTRCITEICLCG